MLFLNWFCGLKLILHGFSDLLLDYEVLWFVKAELWDALFQIVVHFKFTVTVEVFHVTSLLLVICKFTNKVILNLLWTSQWSMMNHFKDWWQKEVLNEVLALFFPVGMPAWLETKIKKLGTESSLNPSLTKMFLAFNSNGASESKVVIYSFS